MYINPIVAKPSLAKPSKASSGDKIPINIKKASAHKMMAFGVVISIAISTKVTANVISTIAICKVVSYHSISKTY